MKASGTNRYSGRYAVDGKHVSPAVNQHMTIGEFTEVVLCSPCLRLHSENQ
jgi:hypothetical protein